MKPAPPVEKPWEPDQDRWIGMDEDEDIWLRLVKELLQNGNGGGLLESFRGEVGGFGGVLWGFEASLMIHVRMMAMIGREVD